MKSVTLCIVTLAVALVVTSLRAEENKGVPGEAKKALKVFVGNWKTEITKNGKAAGTSTHTRKWADGDHCLVMTTTSNQGGQDSKAAGIAGWDAKGKQIVEHWNSSLGLSGTVIYPLDSMAKDLWKGTFSVTLADGTGFDGTCELRIKPNGWTYVSHWTQDGKEMIRKSVTRRADGK